MSLHPLFMAMAAANQENGQGYTLIDPEGRFFCGYEQDDKSLVFGTFRQKGQRGQPAIESFNAKTEEYNNATPVFLSPSEMADRGLAAAAFGVKALAANEEAIPQAIKKECRFGLVRKDLTYKPQHTGLYEISRDGLASSKACRLAEDAGYFSLKKEFASSVREIKSAIRKLFKPSGPSVG